MGKYTDLVEQTLNEGKSIGDKIADSLYKQAGLGKFFRNDDYGLLKLTTKEGDNKVAKIAGKENVDKVRKVVRDVFTKYMKDAIRQYSSDRAKRIKTDDKEYIGWNYVTKWDSTDEEEKVEMELHTKAKVEVVKQLNKVL